MPSRRRLPAEPAPAARLPAPATWLAGLVDSNRPKVGNALTGRPPCEPAIRRLPPSVEGEVTRCPVVGETSR
jgi:hypothetical protein